MKSPTRTVIRQPAVAETNVRPAFKQENFRALVLAPSFGGGGGALRAIKCRQKSGYDSNKAQDAKRTPATPPTMQIFNGVEVILANGRLMISRIDDDGVLLMK